MRVLHPGAEFGNPVLGVLGAAIGACYIPASGRGTAIVADDMVIDALRSVLVPERPAVAHSRAVDGATGTATVKPRAARGTSGTASG